MSKLLMLSGLPASGKSTYAEDLVKNSGGGWVRVNKDLIRTMLHADKFTYANEKVTFGAEQDLAEYLLAIGKNVIVDDTNLGQRHHDTWKGLVDSMNQVLEPDEKPITFSKRRFKVSFKECLERNWARGLKVPQSAIHRMATQYKMIDGHWKPIIICDLDGTIADLQHRLHHIQKENATEEDYRNFYSSESIAKDGPIQEVIDMVQKEEEAGKTIIFVSGRSDESRQATEDWLYKHINFGYSALLMRQAGDKRPDTEVKKDFLLQVLKDYDIEKVYDDRPSVIRMWRENGLEVIDCGDGVEF